MKKFLAVMFAVMFAFSTLAVGASAVETNINIDGTDEGIGRDYECAYCDSTFASAALRDAHEASNNPIDGHIVTCGHLLIDDATGYVVSCERQYQSRAALKEHQDGCGASNFQLFIGYLKMGDIGNALKYLFKAIVEFLKSETFSKIIDVVKKAIDAVVGVVKGIDFGSLLGKVKDVAGKIPMDKIGDAIGGLVK